MGRTAMPRLFTGVEIPADVGKSLSMLRGGLPGARWIPPENHHLTLRFIGDGDDLIPQEDALMLGRVKRDASRHAVAESLSARRFLHTAAFRVSRFVLFSSRSSVGGCRYVVEASYP